MTGGAVGRVAPSRNDRLAGGDLGRPRLGLAGVRRSPTARGCSGRPRARARLDRARRARHAGLHRVVGLSRSRSRARARPSSSPARPAPSAASPGQLARLRGCRVVGSAGTAEKVAWLDELGLRRGVRLPRLPTAGRAARGCAGRDRRLFRQRRRRAPGGGDRRLRTHGRVVACGAISRYKRARLSPARATCSCWSRSAWRSRLHHLRPLRPLHDVPRRHLGAMGCGTAGAATARPSWKGIEKRAAWLSWACWAARTSARCSCRSGRTPHGRLTPNCSQVQPPFFLTKGSRSRAASPRRGIKRS